jgi:two-component system, NtrC family, sensor kinase
MQQTSVPRALLARSTLIKMGVRIAVIILLTTLFSYLHMLHTLRTEALAQLEQHVLERGQREQAIFVLAEDNHSALKQALEEKIRAYQQQDVSARFDSLFVRLPDGTVRSRTEGFDGKRMAGLFVPRGVALDDDLRRRILASYDVLNQYGPAFHTRFTDTFVALPEGPMILYWPDGPTYCLDAAPTESIITQEFFPLTLPKNNPQRRTAWTGVYQDPISGNRMVTASIPLDMDGRHVASISHDVFLEELVARTANDRIPGAYNIIFRDDGRFIAHPPNTTHPQSLFERVKNRQPGQRVLELPESDEYLAVTRLQGPGWSFATVLPRSVVSRPAFQAARHILLLGVMSLLLELAIMYWVLQQQLTQPLLALTQATHRVASGGFQVELDTLRKDELGQLAQAFRVMADKVQQREEELRQANERLEQRVEERTRELKEVHQQLVRTARQAGMAEVATNVLHNVGNVLNSVYTSAQLAKELLTDMMLEQVSQVSNLLQERQADLCLFLTQDERGRHIRPFLHQLGQNLVEERKELLSLLDDVSRYTEHIGDIVKMQQSYARTPRLHEPVSLEELVQDALRINEAGLSRHEVKVERRLASLSPILTDKHKVLMILVNLVSNAKYALDAAPSEDRLLTVKLEPPSGERIRIEVQDNGMGIKPEMLTRIFQYGFTTRQEGHGFGLHSSAVAAQELGGSLTAYSDGPGRGATFTLELPYHPGVSQ